jgi:hypothetical protein
MDFLMDIFNFGKLLFYFTIGAVIVFVISGLINKRREK